MTKHYKAEVGTDLILDVGINLASVTSQFIKYKSPSGVEGTWTASLYNSYSTIAELTGTYLLIRDLTASDFNESGDWKLQAFIATIDGTWYGESVKITIYDYFE